MSHYCCKRCGQRYDDCYCKPPTTTENKPMTKPITPDEAIKSAKPDIPPEVFEVFNELIVKGMAADGVSRVRQHEAVMAVATKMMITRAEAFSRKLLAVEEHYRKAGWSVEYHKPPYYDASDPYFIFTKPFTGHQQK